jgi:iron complex outermembrane receptor protein
MQCAQWLRLHCGQLHYHDCPPMNRLCSPQAVAWAAATLCALMASAHAQPTADDTSAETLPAVRITGTSLRRIDAETALPVIVLRRADIERSGAKTTTELLQQLPVMQGVVPTTSVVGTDSKGYASVSIHDLGDAYTLVLLNGQRTAPFGGQLPNGALPSVDINTIPLAMVERIEVLTDGASALYGADALGGVVNIITRRDGGANEGTIGWTLPKGGAREWRASAIKSIGTLEANGQNLSLAGSVMHRSALSATKRDYASNLFPTFEQDGQRYRYAELQGRSAPANVYSLWGNVYYNANSSCPSGQYDYYGLCLYNYTADLDIVPAQKQHSLMASYTQQVGPDSKLQMDALWSRSLVSSHLAPASATFTIDSSSPLYAAYLTGLGATTDPVDVEYRFVDAGRRGFEDSSTLTDLAMRLEGRLQGWQWQSALKYSLSQQRSDIYGAMGKQAANGLVANNQIDPFLAPGQQSASGLAAIRRQVYNGNWVSGSASLLELQAQASSELMPLPGGPLKWSVGANVRQEKLSTRPSPFAAGLLPDPAAGTVATSGDGDLRLGDDLALKNMDASRIVWGAFTEWLAPVTPQTDLGAAVRADHDELSGNALTGKASMRWRVSPSMLWRASLGTGFKAPTLGQLRSPDLSSSVDTSSQACTAGLQEVATRLGVAPCTDGTSQAYHFVNGGNDQLRPEHSIQGSLGMRIEPLPGHSIGFDLWAVHIHDRIGGVDETVAFSDPKAYMGAWTTVSNQLAFNGQVVNRGTLMSSGLDVDASVRRASALGLFDSQLRVSTVLREDSQLYPGGPWSSSIGDGTDGTPTLKWRATWRTSLIRAGWTHSVIARYQSGYDDMPRSVEPIDANGQPTGGDNQTIQLKVPGQVLWDWQSTWQLNSTLQMSVGVINVFNTKPPMSLSGDGVFKGQMLGYDERYFDPRGRMLTLEAKLSF